MTWQFLPYLLRFMWRLWEETEEANGVYNPVVFPDEDTKIHVSFFLSQREFTELYSCIDKGAILTYPDRSEEVSWYFLRNFEMPYDLCQLIADCISDTESPARQAVKELVMTDTDINTYITNIAGGLTTEVITGELIAGSCDQSVVAGKMMALVGALDQNNIDAIEVIEVGTNDEEKVSALLTAIPIVQELPFDDIILFLQDMFEDLGENYVAASTTERKEELAEDLYCLALGKPECALTYEDLFNFFQERISSGLTLDSLVTNIVEWIIGGDFSSDDLVFNMYMAAQVAFTRVGKQFFGINVPKIGALTRDAEPSSIWETWTECGEPPPADLTFTDFYSPTQWADHTANVATYIGLDGSGHEIWDLPLKVTIDTNVQSAWIVSPYATIHSLTMIDAPAGTLSYRRASDNAAIFTSFVGQNVRSIYYYHAGTDIGTMRITASPIP